MFDTVSNSGDVNTRSLMSDTKFYEGYSRWDDVRGRYETWEESVARVMNMHREYYKDKMTPQLEALIDEAEKFYVEKYALGAQRALQFGGDQLLKHQLRMYNCFDRSTRFLTNKGMKSFNDFEEGDNVTVQSHTRNWQTATVKKYGTQPVFDITFKQRLTRRTVKATANHRWLLDGENETTTLQVGDKLRPYADDRFNCFNWDTATPEEQLYWCYGYMYGDGSTQEGYSKVRLCGQDIKFLARFESFGWKTTSPLSINGDVIMFTGHYDKTLPNIVQDGEDLTRAFVRGYLDADGGKDQGYWTENGNRFNYIYAKSPAAQTFIRDVFPAVGVTINSEHVPDNTTNFGVNDGVRFEISTVKRDSRKWEVESITSAGEVEVWCLEVDNDHSFVLEGGIITGNCTSSYADRPRFFSELFYVLLCGAGAGFSVQFQHVAKLPNLAERRKQAKGWVIEDSIEGWADALGVLLSSFFVGGGQFPEFEGRKVNFDLSQIRPKGSLISGGFKAPGPEPLRRALDKIEHLIQSRVLRGESRLRTIDVYDIAMHAADAVLAGGVRRSATICLFSIDDMEMATAKTGNWFEDNKQRARSNNSAVVIRDEATRDQFNELMTSIKQFGEPGFYFVEDANFTTNPCVEIGMFPQIDGVSGWQGCNLAEINGSKCTTAERFYQACRTASILGTLQAGYTKFKYLDDITSKIFEREALLGVSVTGWMNNPDVLLDPTVQRAGAEIVKQTNKIVADLIHINQAARTTCVKPSGNASVLLETASGIHGEHSPRFLRHVTLNKESEVAQLILANMPYMVEETIMSTNKTDYTIAFPVISPIGSKYRTSLHGVKLLDNVKLVQQNWVEAGTNIELCIDPRLRHNVSNTVTVHDGNWQEVEDYLWENRHSFAGVSFLAGDGDKDYAQAPFTEVLTADEIVDRYGKAALFAAGLIVDTRSAGFRDLWEASFVAQNAPTASGELSDIRRDWVRRFNKFADNYFDGNKKETEYCLKDVYLLHKWTKIQQNLKPIDYVANLGEKRFTEIDTMGAIACQGAQCEISF